MILIIFVFHKSEQLDRIKLAKITMTAKTKTFLINVFSPMSTKLSFLVIFAQLVSRFEHSNKFYVISNFILKCLFDCISQVLFEFSKNRESLTQMIVILMYSQHNTLNIPFDFRRKSMNN